MLNGLDALKAANEAAQKIDLKLLGVSVLTSLDDNDLESLGFNSNVENQVKKLIKIANEAKLYGVICSPLETKMIKKIAPNLKCFTQGIRMENNNNEQKRVMNANEAIQSGSDCIIISRSIKVTGNTKANLQNIISYIE